MERNILTITAIPKEVKEILKIIAKNSIQTRSELLRPILRQIVEKHKGSLKIENSSNSKDYIRITGVSKSVLSDLKEIAQNMGISESQLVKIELNNIIQSLPDYIKNPD